MRITARGRADSLPTFSRKNFGQSWWFLGLVSVVVSLAWLPWVSAQTNCLNVTEIPKEECDALVNFYTATGGPDWSDSSSNQWNKTDNPCSWTGVTCVDGHVTEIERRNKRLSGTLPDLKNLTHLQTLNLSFQYYDYSDSNSYCASTYYTYNDGSKHPYDYSDLRNQLKGDVKGSFLPESLQKLELSGNQLDMTLPDFSELINLKFLDLSYNKKGFFWFHICQPV